MAAIKSVCPPVEAGASSADIAPEDIGLNNGSRVIDLEENSEPVDIRYGILVCGKDELGTLIKMEGDEVVIYDHKYGDLKRENVHCLLKKDLFYSNKKILDLEHLKRLSDIRTSRQKYQDNRVKQFKHRSPPGSVCSNSQMSIANIREVFRDIESRAIDYEYIKSFVKLEVQDCLENQQKPLSTEGTANTGRVDEHQAKIERLEREVARLDRALEESDTNAERQQQSYEKLEARLFRLENLHLRHSSAPEPQAEVQRDAANKSDQKKGGFKKRDKPRRRYNRQTADDEDVLDPQITASTVIRGHSFAEDQDLFIRYYLAHGFDPETVICREVVGFGIPVDRFFQYMQGYKVRLRCGHLDMKQELAMIFRIIKDPDDYEL